MRNELFKILYSLRAYNVIKSKLKKGKLVTVLCFHRISDEKDIFFSPLKIEVFKELIFFIKKNFEVVGMNDLEDYNYAKPPLIITFDDGDSDFLHNALPILKANNLKAIQHIVPDVVDGKITIWTQVLNQYISNKYFEGKPFSLEFEHKRYQFTSELKQTYHLGMELYYQMLKAPEESRNKFISNISDVGKLQKMMTWEEIRYCSANGIEIGSHTMRHNSLPTITKSSDLEYEISLSKQVIEKQIGQTVNAIAFPNGQYNEEVVQYAQNSGFQYLFSTQEDFYNPSKGTEVIPRISITHNNFYESIMKTYNFHNRIKHIVGRKK